LVYARTQAEHDDRLRTVLEHFRRANITLNDKCEFSVKEIRWAGHVISGTGIRPDPDRVKAVCNMPPPTNVREVRCFLGMTNQLAKFASGPGGAVNADQGPPSKGSRLVLVVGTTKIVRRHQTRHSIGTGPGALRCQPTDGGVG
jgi:hypothetical protein